MVCWQHPATLRSKSDAHEAGHLDMISVAVSLRDKHRRYPAGPPLVPAAAAKSTVRGDRLGILLYRHRMPSRPRCRWCHVRGHHSLSIPPPFPTLSPDGTGPTLVRRNVFFRTGNDMHACFGHELDRCESMHVVGHFSSSQSLPLSPFFSISPYRQKLPGRIPEG